MVPGTLIIGHRGASQQAPENTLASFRLAFEQGADGIEADFRLSREGEIVCLHDDGALRTGGVDLKAGEATLAELGRLDVGAWKGTAWAGERIPTLKEVLGALPKGKLIFIELKSGAEIVAPLAQLLAGSDLPAAQVRLLSFDPQLIRLLKERLPGYRACWLTDYRFRGAWRPSHPELLATLAECRADGLASRDRAPLDAPLVRVLRERDLELHVWTVDSARAARRLCALGVDSIMTNRPGWLRRSLAQTASPPAAAALAGVTPAGPAGSLKGGRP